MVKTVDWLEITKVIILGIVEGIPEWLPISSTGHMILVDEFIKLNVSTGFMSMFLVVIQLGAILAVLLLYWKKLLPISFNHGVTINLETLTLWTKIVIACLPAGIIGIFFNKKFEELFNNPITVASTLIFYGIVFIIVERVKKNSSFKVNSLNDISYFTAFGIGVFQVLSLVPGTSRSGATILGGMILGVSRAVVTEFTFFLAVPIMFGASLLKLRKFGLSFTLEEFTYLILGMVTAFLISIISIKFLVGYIRNHSFTAFGWYRIILGLLVLVYFYF